MNDIVKLDDVAKNLFGLAPQMARRKAALGTLPVPAFRLGASRKGPFFIRQADIDALVEKRAAGAEKLQRAMASVTKVVHTQASTG